MSSMPRCLEDLQHIKVATNQLIPRVAYEMRFLWSIVAIGVAVATPVDEYVHSLEGAHVFRVNAKSHDELTRVLSYQEKHGFEILKYGHKLGEDIQMFVTAENVEDFKEFLHYQNISNVVTTENVREAVEEEAFRQRQGFAARSEGRISFTHYPRYDTIVDYMKGLAEDRSDIATLIFLGNSTEGREIYGLKLSSGGITDKPAILVSGTFHAREWITPVTVIYFINEFIENERSANYLSRIDWYFFPVINPDGYEFSHTTYRLWRKTRNQNPGSSCRGVDLNRNYGHYWMETGASSDRCSDIYAGSEPFSEPEARHLRDFILDHSDTIKLFLDYHSYGGYFLYPWGYSRDLPENANELHGLAVHADQAQSGLRGTRYVIGSAANALYPNAGNSIDWVAGEAGIGLAYVIELPGGGLFGFDIPASQIQPVAEESFLALRSFAEYIAIRYGKFE